MLIKIRYWKAIALICWGVCLFGLPANGATWLDPNLKWHTLETKHFSINYYEGLEEAAVRLAPISERIYDKLTKIFKYRLDLKTEVNLLDVTDSGNGFTTVFPYPNITLYLTDLASNLNPYKYDDYLYYLFLHEYVHALHLDIAEGSPSILRLIFGRTIFPNAMSPSFITEGLATYMETSYTNAGRGRDPRWEMMMRQDVLDDQVKSLDQAAVDTIEWPMGHLRYLYGVHFLNYLAKTYGEDKLVTFAHVYGDFLFSFTIDGAFTFVFGKNLPLLWEEWLDAEREQAEKLKSSLGKLTEPQLITNTGYYNLKPKWGRDSRNIYYLQHGIDRYPAIRSYNLQSGRDEKITEAQVLDENFAININGSELIYSQAGIYHNYYLFNDLYKLNLSNRRSARLTNGLRALDPAIFPDGQKLLYVRNEKGRKWLEQEGLPLTSSSEGAQYFSPAISGDSKLVAVAKYLPGIGQHIYLLDLSTRQERLLFSEGVLTTEANPTFSPDGRYILFDSDRTGIVNLYAYELNSQKLFQITNVIGGAEMPAVSPDAKNLAYVSYSSRGYDLAVLNYDPANFTEVKMGKADQTTRTNTPEVTSSSQNKFTNIHDYNPWPSLLPRFWMPDTYYNENGDHTMIYLGGLDPLQQHIYYLDFGYDSTGRKPFYGINYINNQFLPQISLSMSDTSAVNSVASQNYIEQVRQGRLLFTFYNNHWLVDYDQQALSLGVETLNLTTTTTLTAFNPRPNLGQINSFILSWSYQNSRTYPASISPEDGLDFGLSLENATATLNSDYYFTNYFAGIKNYFALPWKHQVLASKLNGFLSRGTQLQQGNLTWRYLTLRGYPEQTIQGSKGVTYSMEYRFPLWYTERGILYGYTFLDRVWGDLFFDLGGATFGSTADLALKRGVGAELNFAVSNLWGYLGLTLKVGYAKGLDPGGEESCYFTMGM